MRGVWLASILAMGLLATGALVEYLMADESGISTGSGITPGQPWVDTGTDLETIPDRDVVIIDATPTLELRDSTTDAADFELWSDNDVFYLADRENSRQFLYYVAGNNAVYVPNLVSCDTIDTSSTGQLRCGVDSGGGGNSFETISVPAGTNPVADSSTDTLTITETSFLTITGTAGTDTIDITQVTTDIGTDGLIAANAVALTDDTTGNYAADVTAGRSLTKTSSASEGQTVDLVADVELYTDTKCILIETPADADDFLWFRTDQALTVTGLDCIVENSTDAIAQVVECNADGNLCGSANTRLDESMTCAVTNTADDGTIGNAGVVAGAWLRLQVGAVTGTPGHQTTCVTFTLDD